MLDDTLNDDQHRDVESVLRSLRPATAAVNPIAAAFAAGERNGRRATRRWQSVAAAMLVVGLAAQWRPGHLAPRGRADGSSGGLVVSPVAPAPTWSDQSVLMLQRVVGERGVDALPPVRVAPVPSLGRNDTL